MGASAYMQTNGNHYPCPVCKKDPKTCPHSLTQMDERVWENRIREIVRDELARARTAELRRKSGVG